MSSGFVSGGTTDAPNERNDEWLAAQKEIEANIVRKQEQARHAEGKSLGALKQPAAKQEAFEEANRLKNQFRALDEDEIEFLDSVLESTRAEEARVKKETAEGLALFRQHQEEAEKKARIGSADVSNPDEGSPVAEEESWVASGRKRKRTKEKEVLKGVKIRRSSTANEGDKCSNQSSTAAKPTDAAAKEATADQTKEASKTDIGTPVETKKPPAVPKTSGLVGYASDDDDDW
ncbi:N-terminal domain of NEFA-interacting nuclear protein NIP30-domain-containing protein [Amylocarpus encephaloides]|uniref:N-terminal domain of NEFA-interacting nuclear protein NIP30-domain-containing protein n=1 Tax=Amylocarpus encephaloides TaxID=45428 RepID=A0A9P8C332_9HELO|nr:N-terminal domain of NEFA-interacting nuclear protein NIP30-domain-containing protein [Amylocarpus encephaloides]